jgi:hypothetical protein
VGCKIGSQMYFLEENKTIIQKLVWGLIRTIIFSSVPERRKNDVLIKIICQE